jgi:hypothetical protein
MEGTAPSPVTGRRRVSRDSHVRGQGSKSRIFVPQPRLQEDGLRTAGGGSFETTVDQTLMRGLGTARPRIRLGPASVSSRASIGIGHRITSRVALPCFRLRRCAAMSMVCAKSSFPDERLCSSGPNLLVGCDGPDEGGEFARDGDVDLLGFPAMTSRRCLAHNRT